MRHQLLDILAARLAWLDNNIEKAGPCSTMPPDSEGSFEMKVWSNPVSNPLNLDIISDKDQTLQLIIVNVAGQRILQSSVSVLNGSNTMQISTGSWTRGVYVIKAFSNDGTKKTLTIEK